MNDIQELSKRIFDTTRAKTILANQNSLAHNEVLSKTPAYKQKIKQLGTPYIKELIKLEAQEFDKVQLAEETLENFKGQNVIDQAFEKSNRIITLLARAVFVDYDDVEMILTALAKDPSSMKGIAKKILK
jgi:hypothetical protein